MGITVAWGQKPAPNKLSTRAKRLDELACFGGSPTFTELVCIGRPNIGNQARLDALVADALARGWLSNNGPYVQQLEQLLAEYLQVKHCKLVCNGTIGLQITARACGLSGEVIVPSMTFVATPHALEWMGITPVFAEVEGDSHNLDPSAVEAMITPKTSAILAVHLWGRPAAIEALTAIANRHNLKIIFDAAHAFGCSHKGKMIGNFGDAEVFSFHATKFFNTFEGGAITTNDDELARKIESLRNFGQSDDGNQMDGGTNGKMTEIAAAMGLASWELLDEFIDSNHRNYLAYCQGVANIPGITLLRHSETESANYQYIILEIDERVAGVNRDHILAALAAENVIGKRYFYPGCHHVAPYLNKPDYVRAPLTETDRIAACTLALPTGTAVSPEQIATICGLIELIVYNHRRFQEKWNNQ